MTAVGGSPFPRPLYAWYAVVLLSVSNALSFVARTILSLLVDPVKSALHVSDTAVSLLHGFSFALIFAIIGLPVSVLADRGNRRNIIAGSILLWSLMTAFCGAARSYSILFIGRLGAGAGEGGFGPPSYSIMTDYFPKEKLPIAVGVHSMGIFIGMGVALLLGGWIAQWAVALGVVSLPFVGTVEGWQIAFFMVGLPGVVLALLFVATVREPLRQIDSTAGIDGTASGWRSVWRQLSAERRTYVGLILGYSLHVLIGYGASAWTPAYLARHFSLSPGEIGLRYGLTTVFSGLLGAFAGGYLASLLRSRGLVKANVWVGLFSYGCCALTCTLYFYAASARAVIGIAGVMNLFASAGITSGFAAIQEITPNRMRAQAAAIFLFFLNLVGTGLGPTVVAVLAEHSTSGSAALGQSIALTACLVGPVATVLLWIARKHYPVEQAAVEPAGALP